MEKECTYYLVICDCSIELTKEEYDKLMERAKKRSENVNVFEESPDEKTKHTFTAFRFKKEERWKNDLSLSKWEEEY